MTWHDILHHSARALPFILCASSAMVAPEVSSACAARMACRMWLQPSSLSFVTAPCLLQAGRELRPKVVWTRRVAPGHFQKHPNSKRALKRHPKTAGRKEDERLWYEERMGTEPWEFIQLLWSFEGQELITNACSIWNSKGIRKLTTRELPLAGNMASSCPGALSRACAILEMIRTAICEWRMLRNNTLFMTSYDKVLPCPFQDFRNQLFQPALKVTARISKKQWYRLFVCSAMLGKVFAANLEMQQLRSWPSWSSASSSQIEKQNSGRKLK